MSLNRISADMVTLSNGSKVSDQIGSLSDNKADKTEVTVKADKTYVDSQDALKRDKSTLIDMVDLSNAVKAAMAGTTSIFPSIKYGSVAIKNLSFIKRGKNLFDKSAATSGYNVDYTNGNLVVNASFYASDFILVDPSTTYTRNGGTYGMAFYDANQTYISGDATNLTFTTPANCYFVRASVSNSTINTYQLEKGSSSTTFEPFYQVVPNSVLEGLRDSSINLNQLSFSKTGKNLFDKSTVTAGYSVSNTTGALAANASFTASDYIYVQPNTTYTRIGTYGMAFYDIYKNFISGDASNATFTTPANCYFVRISMTNALLNTFQLEQGSAATTYEPFSRVIKNTAIEKITSEQTSFYVVGSNLFNKSDYKANTSLNLTGGSAGTEATATNFTTSGFIACEASTDYTFTKIRGYCFYDAGKNFISSNGTTDVTGQTKVNVTSPSNAAFMKIYFYASDGSTVDNMQINKGKNLLAYEVWHKYIPRTDVAPNRQTINLPSKISGVVGSKLSIYFQNIINVDLSRYWIDVTCSVGKQYKNRWEYTPDTTGTYTLTIDLYDQENNYLATANTTITVKSSTVGTGINRNSIFIGDSTLNAGVVTQRLLDDFSADPMDITLYGTRGTGSNKYEGRGGWSAATYRTNTVYSGVANPFYDSGTSDFNFNKYMTDKGYPVPDYVFIQLGINGIVGATDDAGMNSIIASEKANYDFIINNIHAYNSSIKICVYVTFPPNEDQDAFANAYGCDINQWRYKRSNFNWASNLISSYQGREAENIYIVPVNVALDCVNGYTVDDPAGGAVHPNTTGYNQIGDAVYQFLKGLES